jgi:hypothetical protein
MSLNIRWLTNGEKTVFTIVNSLDNTFTVVESIQEIHPSIRHYAESVVREKGAPVFCEPDLARIFGVQELFYPDWPKRCSLNGYDGRICIAESCKYSYKSCPYIRTKDYKPI